MSLSKCYTSTPETTNTARLARLILGPCTDVLRDVLKIEVKPSDLSRKIKEFTDKLPRGQRNPLNKIQSEIIFPKATNQYSGDYSDLDISLLYLLLRNVSKIAPHSKGWGEIPNPADRSVAANIERIRLIRNQYYGHSADPSLSGSEFRQEWRNIRDIVVELERHLGATTVYQDAVTTIKTCSMDPEQEKKYIDLLGDIRELHTTVNNISNKMQIIQDSALQYDPKVARKIEITQKMLIKHNENMTPFFVKTRAYNKAKELLEAKRYIIIKGNPGTGKTTIAKMLMKELMEEGKSALQLQKFTDLYESVSPGDGTVVLIDNVFGEFSFSSGDIKDLSATAELVTILIENVTDCKSNNLIFTIRNDIYNEYVGMVHNDTFFVSSMVDISDKTYALQEAEILQLADKYDLKNTIEKQDLLRKVHEMPIWIGFPQCCKLAKSNAVIKQKISDFLLDPKMFLREYFKILIKTQTSKSAVLAYLLLSGGRVEFELIDNAHKDLELKRTSLEFVGLQTFCIHDFQDSINCFDQFLTIRDKIKDCIRFSHSSVQESLFNVMFYIDPEKMIQHCHPSLLQTLTTCKKSNDTHVLIEQNSFDAVAIRIAKISAERSVTGYASISLLELWTDSNFHEYILHRKKCVSKLKTCRDINDDSIMVHFSRVGNKKWVEYLLPNSDKRQRYRSVNAACSRNHTEIVNLILHSGVKCDITTCLYSIQSGNLELLFQVCESVGLRQVVSSLHPVGRCVRYSLIQEIFLKQKPQFIKRISKQYSSFEELSQTKYSNALQSAASFGDKHAFNLLLNFGFDPYERDKNNGHTVLTYACQNERLEMVKYLIEIFPRLLEIRDNNGWTVLHSACSGGSVEIVSFLIEKGMDINTLSNDGKSILHIACLDGKFEVCEYLVQNHSDLLQVKDKANNFVLHDAIWGGNIQFIQLLIEKKMDIRTLYENVETILHLCCRSGKMEMCEYLVKHFSNLLEMRDNDGWTALHSACFGGSKEIVNFLLNKGLDINALSNDGKSILHIACFSGKFEVCKYLVENNPHLLHVRDKSSETVLHDAAWGGNVQIVELLIEKKMDVNSRQESGETILHQCCRSGKMEMCEYLVNHFPDLLEIRDNRGKTVLHSACWGGSVEIVSFLLEKGMSNNTLSDDGKSILHRACVSGKFEVCDYLVENYPHLLQVRDKSSVTVLHDAAWGGNVQVVQLLIDKKMDVNSRLQSGATILHQCCRSGKMEMCEFLVNHFPDLLKIRDNRGWTVLHSACYGGSVEFISFLIENGLDLNAVSNEGKSILHRACVNGKFEVCKYLVENNPHLLQVRDKSSETVLHDAAWGGNVQIVELLIEKKMDVNSRQESGETILHQCCRSGKMEMCEYLVNHFPDLLEIRDNRGKTVLHSACWGGSVEIVSFLLEKGMSNNTLSDDGKSILHSACVNGKFEVCDYLIKNYPHLLQVRDKSSVTVLHDAAWGGNVQVVQLLIDKKMDVNSRQESGETILHQCCRSGEMEICEYLVNHFPDLLKIRDNRGKTVLHSACWGGSVEIVSFLLEKGMSNNTLSDDGKSILHRACVNGKFEVCDYLVKNYPHLLQVRDKSSVTVLHDAAWGGNVQVVQLLIDKKMDVNSRQESGETILHQCCRSGEMEICEYLVNHFPDLLKIRDNRGWTVLHSACYGGSVEFISFLIENGLDLNAVSNDGKSILHIACFSGKFEVCKYLVENNPHLLQVRDKSSETVLHDAAWGGNVQIVELLIEKKMDVNSRQESGETILHQCCRSGIMEMCEYLVNHFPDLLEIRDNRGKTVLHSACWGGSVEIVSFLLEKGMSNNTLSDNGKSILHRACVNGKFEVCDYLVENYPNLLQVRDKSSVTVLHDAAWGGNVQVVQLLIDKKMDVNFRLESGETILHQCCRSGKMEMCEYLVNHFPDLLEIKDNRGQTVLHSACWGGSVEIVSFLIEKGMSNNTLSDDGKSILHITCLNGKFEVCEYLIENYPHLLDVRDKSSNTVLHDASWGGNVQIVNLLIDKKMDVNSRQESGETILHQCCRSGEMEMCEYLVNHFPDLLKIRDNRGWTVLHSACYGGSVEFISFLIENGLDLNVVSNDGKSILHRACVNGKFEVCDYLVENYPHLLHVRDKSSETVLHDAAWGGNVQVVQLLIDKKMDVYSREEGGETILHQCCRSGKMEMCEYLVNHFPDLLEIRDNDGWTVLHSACWGGESVEIVIFLVENGLDFNAVSYDGKSILHIACLSGKFETCEFLVEIFPHLLDVRDEIRNSVLHDAAIGGNVQIIKLLIEEKMDVSFRQQGGETILHLCCRSGKMNMCEYLVNHFPDLLARKDNDGWTALHSACYGGSVEIVIFLIENGLDFNAVSNDGKSILHIACFSGKFEICQFLVEICPHLLDLGDSCGNSVLYDAALGGNVRIVKLLVEKNMDINSLLDDCETILHQCRRSGKIEMCQYLVNHFSDLLLIRDYGWTE